MKTTMAIATTILLALTLTSCGSTMVVRERPVGVSYSRPIAPSPRHIWIDGGWYYSGGRYIERPGYWAVPRRNRVYVPGHWQQQGGGWNWHKGGWKRGH